MRRSALALLFVIACSGDDEPDCPGVGCFADTGTASSAGTTASTSTSASTSTTATTTSASTTAGSESTGDLESSSSAGESATTMPATTSAESSSSESGPPPCEGADCPTLAECFGLGVWQSCTQYCEAGDATCVASGCDGATVVYYGDVDACVAMESSNSSAQGCDEGFDMGGGNSFGRCCCD